LPGTVAVTSDEEVAAELGMVTVTVQQVPGDHQDRVAHGDAAFFVPMRRASRQDCAAKRGQAGIAGAAGGPGTLDEDLHRQTPALAGRAPSGACRR
jgi:hypothetical protein